MKYGRRLLFGNRIVYSLLLAIAVSFCQAKEPPAQEIVWPASGTPVLRFSFGKFKQMGSLGKQHAYQIDTTAENVWNKRISKADFLFYVFDKDKARIGEGYISVSNINPGEVVKFQTAVDTTGTPLSVSLVPRSLPPELGSYLPPKTISMTVNSVPQGADIKIDGQPAGITPKVVQVAPGKHLLEFSKEGFNVGKFPLEVGPEDASGGSVSYELGTSAHDTVELRDGTLLNGDLESVTATEVVVRVGGSLQHLNRNQVKRIGLVEREMPNQ